MCFDPVSLALGALGMGANVIGGGMNAQAMADQAGAVAQDNSNAAKASNEILSQFEDKQAGNQATNTAALQPVYNAIDPATFAASQAGLANSNSAQATKAITDTLASVAPPSLTNTDNGQSAAEIAKRIGARTDLSKRDASNKAALDSYGQAFSDLGLTETDANRKIDTVNANARRDVAALPAQQANAALQARRYVGPADLGAGTALQGLGNLFASIGGSGAGKSAAGGVANWWNNPSLPIGNGMTSNGFSVGGA